MTNDFLQFCLVELLYVLLALGMFLLYAAISYYWDRDKKTAILLIIASVVCFILHIIGIFRMF